MRCLLRYLLVLVGLAFSISMPAQDLPALPQDGAITTGALTNGISYYLVTNASEKGTADFALVRKGCMDTLSARKVLSGLPHFNKTIPYRFLSRKNIGCRKDGYISYDYGSTIFRFDNVPVSDQAASDTTLLMLFDIIASEPAQHTVIVAGDINPGNIIEKMKVFSLMVPSRNPIYDKPAYSFQAAEEPVFSFVESDKPSVTMDFRAPRTPDGQMRTILPFMSELFSLELREVLKERLKAAFQVRGIPVSSCDITYKGSATTLGDEHFMVTTNVPQSQLLPASMAMASVISETASKGVSEGEFKVAKEIVTKKLLQAQTNDELVRRCISSSMCGSDLASPASKIKFFSSKNMTFKNEISLFNNYVSALIGEVGNLEVCWHGTENEYDDWTRSALFSSAWRSVQMLDNPISSWKVAASDTSSLWTDHNKTKLKTSASESTSGGEMWTFTNGMRVIYKKNPAMAGKICYSMMMKGGYSTVKNIQMGEGAFFSDILTLRDVSGLTGDSFSKLMKINGIDMNCKVSANDITISGTAPSNLLPLVLKSILSITNETSVNLTAFQQYKSMALPTLKTNVVDSLLYRDNVYTDVKYASTLTDHTLNSADACFSSQFIRANDGVIMIYGDIPYEKAQKVLGTYLGGFRVSKSSSIRPNNSYKLRSGTISTADYGQTEGFQIGFAYQQSFTTENYMAFKVAGMALQKHLVGAMAEKGYNVSISDKFTLYPLESMELVLDFVQVPQSGLPEGIVPESSADAMISARKIINEFLAAPVDGGTIQFCKAALSNDYAILLADPSRYVDAVMMRYSCGKDVITNYAQRINNVSADNVKAVYGHLQDGIRVEYVIKKK